MSESVQNVAELLLGRGESEAPALLAGVEVVTYGCLRARVDCLANALLGLGLSKGDMVGIYADNGVFFVSAYLAIIRAGLVAVPLPANSTPAMLNVFMATTGMREMFVAARRLSEVWDSARRSGVRIWVDRLDEPSDGMAAVDRLFAQGGPNASFPQIDPVRDLAAVMFTSGSTGRPKGVMVTHRNIEVNTRDIIGYLQLTPHDRMMAVLPFYYCFGTSLLHTHLLAGGSTVINNQFMFPEKVLDDMAERNCTGLAGVPSTYQILLRKTTFRKRQFPALRLFQQAGGKLPNPYIREIRDAFPQAQFFIMYGQTEATARLSYLPPGMLDAKFGSIGQGLPSTNLRVLREDGMPVRPGSEEVGEIVASGGNITPGYLKDPEETARYFRNGGLYTGDLARVDADGFIFIVDRERDFIKSAGNRVSPKEVEDVIAEKPEVVEVAVFGSPDALLGEAIHALVVLNVPGVLSEDSLLQHCLTQLPNYKVPQTIRFVQSIPKTSAGKISKAMLKEMFAPREGASSP